MARVGCAAVNGMAYHGRGVPSDASRGGEPQASAAVTDRIAYQNDAHALSKCYSSRMSSSRQLHPDMCWYLPLDDAK